MSPRLNVLEATGPGKSPTVTEIEQTRSNSVWMVTGTRNVTRNVKQAPSCVWVVYLGQWECNSAKAPQTHMFPSPGFCGCVSVGEHYSQNEDPKIKTS